MGLWRGTVSGGCGSPRPGLYGGLPSPGASGVGPLWPLRPPRSLEQPILVPFSILGVGSADGFCDFGGILSFLREQGVLERVGRLCVCVRGSEAYSIRESDDDD